MYILFQGQPENISTKFKIINLILCIAEFFPRSAITSYSYPNVLKVIYFFLSPNLWYHFFFESRSCQDWLGKRMYYSFTNLYYRTMLLLCPSYTIYERLFMCDSLFPNIKIFAFCSFFLPAQNSFKYLAMFSRPSSIQFKYLSRFAKQYWQVIREEQWAGHRILIAEDNRIYDMYSIFKKSFPTTQSTIKRDLGFEHKTHFSGLHFLPAYIGQEILEDMSFILSP